MTGIPSQAADIFERLAEKIESCLISHNRDRQDNLITSDEFNADAHSQEETLNIFMIIE